MGFSQNAAIGVLILAVGVAVLGRFAGEVAVEGGAPGGTDGARPPAYVLGDTTYNVKKIEAPVATGFRLRAIEWVLTRSPVAPFAKRYLLNKNNIHMMRELASQVDFASTPVMYRPIRRLRTPAYQEHTALAAQSPTITDVVSAPGVLPASQHNAAQNQRFWEVEDYAQSYRDGVLTPSQAMERLLEGVETLAELRCFESIHPEDVMRQAAASDARFAAGSPLSVWDGVPIAVKSMMDVKGHVTSSGTLHFGGGTPAPQDDVQVARFRDAGAIIVGTTVMTEFGVTPLGFNSHFNATFNPYDTRYYSGGSSSGSAVAVAAGLVPMAIGADGGGSIRVPSAISGTFGLMPTYARVPYDSYVMSSPVVHVGPLTATARDMALAYAVMAPNEPDHFYSRVYGGSGPPAPHLAGYTADPASLKGLRIGIFRPYLEDAHPAAVRATDAAIAFLTAAGAKIVPIAIPNLQALQWSHSVSISGEFSHTQEWRYFHDNREGHDLPLEPSTRVQLGIGQAVSGVELLAANRLKAWSFQVVNKMFAEEVDVMITPTLGAATPPLSKEARECGESNSGLILQMMKYVFLGNLLGYPAISVPVGYGPGADQDTDEGVLPIGMQIMADHWNDGLLLQLAAQLEAGHVSTLRRRPQHFYDMRLDTPAEV